MRAGVRDDRPRVWVEVAVHADVAITLKLDDDHDGGAAIHIGPDGPDLCLDFADADSLERLAVVAADGVRQLREQENATDPAAVPNREDADQLAGAAR